MVLTLVPSMITTAFLAELPQGVNNIPWCHIAACHETMDQLSIYLLQYTPRDQ